MTRSGLLKWGLVAGLITAAVLLTVPSSRSETDKSQASATTAQANHKPEDFVGSESCKACHTSIHDHADLARLQQANPQLGGLRRLQQTKRLLRAGSCTGQQRDR